MMITSRSLLTVIVPTGNRVDTIEDCLKSVRWADELIVVDSFSNDGTLEIAQKYADRVLRHEYGYSALQKNWAIPQASHEWVLIVDTDERVPPNLRDEILTLLSGPITCKGYKIPRVNYFLGKAVHNAGYYPDYQLRLFMRDHACYDLRRVHAHIKLNGSWAVLQSPLIHYAHRSLDQTLQNLLIQMTTWEAQQRENQSKNYSKELNRHLWFDLLFRPLAAFMLRYIRQGGWRDGYHGLMVSLIWATYVQITYMKIWEKKLNLPEHWWNKDWQDQPQSMVRKD